MQESLGNPYGVMGRAAMAMMKLTTAAWLTRIHHAPMASAGRYRAPPVRAAF